MSTLLQELITAQAERWPDRPAIVWRRTAMTYADLEARSNQLARALRDVGCRRGDRVCVSSMRGPETVIAMLAIYKADAVYVPLDAAGPSEHLARIVRASEPRCILTCAATAPLIDEVFRLIGGSETIPVGSLNPSPIFGERYSTAFCLGDLRQMASRPLPYRNRASNSAQIVFRGDSGSLHGVVLTHASLRRFIVWANEHFGVVAGDRHLLPASAPADLMTFAVLGTLAAGASLHPVPVDVSRSPTRLADFVREAELTLWLSSAGTMGAMAQLDLVQRNDFASLRHLIWHGDSPRPADLRQWLQRLRHVTFTSLYGALETTVASCYHTVPHAFPLEAALPIGRCRPGVGVAVLNERLEAVAAQEVGEVCVSGNGLSPGYWRDPESTSSVFTRQSGGPNGDAAMFRTGDLGYVGTDGHVYLAGTREPLTRTGGQKFEIGQVEAALESLGSVQAAAVVATTTEAEGSVLCCAYVPAAGLNVLPAELRADLGVLLPQYMLPTRWKAFDRLPQTAEGAVEREQLSHWFAENTDLTTR